MAVSEKLGQLLDRLPAELVPFAIAAYEEVEQAAWEKGVEYGKDRASLYEMDNVDLDDRRYDTETGRGVGW